MRVFYSFLFYLLIPFILTRLIWRGFKAPAYRLRWAERFAFYNKPVDSCAIWFHAVSVGESEALFPLIKRLQQQSPGTRLLLTTTTPTGSARVKAVLSDSVEHVYLPYDLPDAVERFLKRFKPKMAVIMETEIWPNLYAGCAGKNIPLYIINARLSERSAKGYRKIPSLIVPALACTKLIAAQTQEDTARFISIGADSAVVKTLGNIKFDIDVPEETIKQGRALKAELFNERFVYLLASSHKDEEALFFDIYRQVKQSIPELVLMIAPRHPERFIEVKRLAEHYGLKVVSRTSGVGCDRQTDIYLADTMGELRMLYAASDAAFVGGSMVPVGGHNILESLAVGTPVMFGPYMANFKEIAQGALRNEAGVQCQSKAEILRTITSLYMDEAYKQALSGHGKAFVKKNQGAITGILAILNRDLSGL